MTVPDKKVTTTMAEAVDYHIDIHNEDEPTRPIVLSPLARYNLICHLEKMEDRMFREGVANEIIRDCITNCIFAFFAGYQIKEIEHGRR